MSSIIASASLVVLCLFYVYSAATFAHLTVYPLIDRVTYYTVFGVYITNEYVDHVVLGSLLIVWLVVSLRKLKKIYYYIAIGIHAAFLVAGAAANYAVLLSGIALASLPVITALLLYNRYSLRKILKNQQQGLTLNYFGILGIILGIIGLAFATASVVSSNAVQSTQPVRNYAYDVFVVLSSFSPVFILLLIACIPVKLVTDSILRALKIRLTPLIIAENHKMRKMHRITYLLLIALSSIVFAVIPHLPTINPDNQKIGVDTGYYINWVTHLNESKDPQEFLYNAFVSQSEGDRPFTLILFSVFQKISNADLFLVVEYSSIILGPLLAISVYFLARELAANDLASLLAAFMTAISYPTLVGIYAGFYANWLALVFGYASFIFLLRFIKTIERKNLLLFALMILLTLLSHVYTWTIVTIVTGAYIAAIFVFKNKYTILNKSIVLIVIVILSVIAIDIVRVNITGSTGGIEKDLELAYRAIGVEQFALRWSNLNYTANSFVGGQLGNFIIYAFALYWLFKVRIESQTILLLIFLSIGLIPVLFGNYVIQTRVLYDIPFQIPAAIALSNINKKVNVISTLLFVIILFNISIIAVSNFYLVLPH
ncbi:hypothetical protein NTE_00282 [Candidatus Nitrososphaera evergladensis SR1]|uniref:Glycosyltransferase RgtA/B/C/D-like domain-containing protein n=2 Tax=Nitrososphaera TaxID=497726 RepID=A0A075MSN7_9ARCH|nr:hypothetical protein NTE_00282 [Candidatus Nitrososphaera evergladensis SR1]